MASLADYLKTKKFSGAMLARKSGVKPPTLSKIKHGTLTPSLELVLRCYIATGGEVTVKETRPDLAHLFDQVALQVAIELEKKSRGTE